MSLTQNRNRSIILLLLLFFSLGIILSLLRYPGSDESYYLRETSLIAETLRNFHWIGDESVGLHGFLFKLPAAFFFMITGPSVFAATFINLIFGLLIIFICYRIFLEITHSEEWALAGSFLLATSVFFLHVFPTYLRDFPVLLSVLLFFYAVLKRKNIWLIGLLFLLILDAKEGVFFIILPGYLLWLFYVEIIKGEKKSFFRNFRRFLGKSAAVQLPVVFFIGLMLFTSLVPLNVKLTSFLGLNQGGIKKFVEYQVTNVEKQYRTEIDKKALPISPIKKGKDGSSGSKFIILLKILILYFKKIFYFRTFSLSSWPRFIVFPALAMSFLCFKEWRKREEQPKLIFQFVLWGFLFVYILRTSHGRYLLPIAPVLILFFILFLKEGVKRKRFALLTLLGTVLFICVGMLFEHEYVLAKVFLYIIIGSGLFLYFFHFNRKTEWVLRIRRALVLLIGFSAICINVVVSIMLPGQIGSFKEWGYCAEFNKIADQFEKEKNLWINIDAKLFRFFRSDPLITFYENSMLWKLKEWVPKFEKMNKDHQRNVFSFGFDDPSQFLQELKKEKIDQVALVVSTSDSRNSRFLYQEKLNEFENMPFLTLENRLVFKNKILYIYKRIS